MMIGGNDIIVSGVVSAEAPAIVRQLLSIAWPDAVFINADLNMEPLPIADQMCWCVPSELLVFHTRADFDNGDPGRIFHIFFAHDEITFVVDDEDIALANEISVSLVSLRVNGLI